MKKYLCIILTLVLVAAFAAGCRSQEETVFTPPSDSTPTESKPVESTPTTPSSQPATEPSSAPATEPTTIPTTPPTEPPTTPPATVPATTPSTPQNDNVIAGGKWDGGPVTWKITKDGVLTISGNRSIQGKVTYTWWDYKDIVTRIVVEDGITTIPDCCFKGMNKVTSVYLGSTIKSIGREAFQDCILLTEVTIPESTKTIDSYAFYNCSQLQTLNFAENCQLETICAAAFKYCAIRSLDIPDQLQTLESESFAECFYLKSIRLDGTLKMVKAYTFQNCKQLTDVYLGSSITTGGTPDYIFKGCTGLTKIENYSTHFRTFTDLPNLTTLILGAAIPQSGTYKDCPSLSSVTFLHPITEISDSAFWGCTSLKSIDIPDTVKKIGNGAFRKSGLTEVTIPASVKQIGLFAFAESALVKATFLGDCPTITNNSAFSDLTVTVRYLAGNSTWTEDVRKQLKGNLTWVAV